MKKSNKFRLNNFSKRTITDSIDIIYNKRSLDTIFDFKVEDLTPVNYIAESLRYNQLIEFIENEKLKGSANIDRYLVAKY